MCFDYNYLAIKIRFKMIFDLIKKNHNQLIIIITHTTISFKLFMTLS